MCSSQEYPCDDVCGGAGCGKCGGLSCDGTVDRTKNALEFARGAEDTLRNKEEEVNSMLTEVSALECNTTVDNNYLPVRT